MNRGLCILLTGLILGATSPLYGKTLVLEGKLDSKIRLIQQMNFAIDKPLGKLSLRFALPAKFANRAVSQDISSLDISFEPRPEKVEDEVDRFGNHYKNVSWADIRSDARVRISFETSIKSELSSMESNAPFPMTEVSSGERIYLVSSEMVQADDPEIVSLSRRLTASATTEFAAVSAILNYVSDNVKYTYNPPRYDALYTVETKTGNCQNYAHVSMALLRAAGIPARIVGGISLKEPWKVPAGNDTSLVQRMGQGGHAWMEIYFPDLGWLSYDPQQSMQFTSSRHIKQTHGIDSRDINDTWRGAPYLPAYSELIDAKYLDDNVALNLRGSDASPRAYVISNSLHARVEQSLAVQRPVSPEKPVALAPPPPPITHLPLKPVPPLPPTTVAPKPAKPAKVVMNQVVEFGNMEFPTFVDIFKVVGDHGMKILDKETSEYVTSKYVYAQALMVNQAIHLEKISLAMHKFGGDGTVYIDLVADDNGKPGFSGIRSNPVFVEKISRKPGYYWVDFAFPADDPKTSLAAGKYWIIMRHSGEAILNWFYIPGKPYGGSDDTRSTAKGYRWEDILTYDFVFKVRGTGKTGK